MIFVVTLQKCFFKATVKYAVYDIPTNEHSDYEWKVNTYTPSTDIFILIKHLRKYRMNWQLVQDFVLCILYEMIGMTPDSLCSLMFLTLLIPNLVLAHLGKYLVVLVIGFSTLITHTRCYLLR